MTVETTVGEIEVGGNDVATVFSGDPLRIFDETDIIVVMVDGAENETPLSLGNSASTYSVQLLDSDLPSTFTVTYPAQGGTPLATGFSLIIKRVLPLLQPVDLENQGGYFPDVQEGALDRLTMIAIQQQEEIDRAIKLAISAQQTPEDLLDDIFQARDDAEAAAAEAQAIADNIQSGTAEGTSITSLTIGTGTKVFETQKGLPFTPGKFILAVNTGTPANYMHGQVISYTGTTLTMDVQSVGGSGTFAAWTISVSGPRGDTGQTGASGAGTGDVVGPGTVTADRIVLFDGTSGTSIKEASEGILPTMTDSDITGEDTARKIPTGKVIFDGIAALTSAASGYVKFPSLSGTLSAQATLDIDIRDIATAGLKHVRIVLSNLTVENDGRTVLMRVAHDTVPTFVSTANAYRWVSQSQSTGGVAAGASNGDTKIALHNITIGNASNEFASFTVELYNPFNSSGFASENCNGQIVGTSGAISIITSAGHRLLADDITFVSFFLSGTGTFSCSYDVYGIA